MMGLAATPGMLVDPKCSMLSAEGSTSDNSRC
ncbi:hypothetical protein SAMN05444858_12426 [Micromonospora avicenniae]|uniref:Uncharacterized protein n=1 Tax=Micromonospora avicenniae TaxID=1198245 RepID=A0A1N7EJ40_9ACTN|nr:hypothetical protein SAMN05444858_12426 [Micromonospora avicenniae]